MTLQIAGCRIRVEFGFPAMLVLVFLWSDAAFLRQSLAVSLMHECGHGAAMCLCGAGLREIRFHAAGVKMRTKSMLLHRKQELCILLAGPAVNLCMAFVLHFLHGWTDAALLHLCMGIFNLLPFSVLDGGSALECLTGQSHGLLQVQTILCLLLAAGMSTALALLHVHNPFLHLMCLFLGISQLCVDKCTGMW
jgi:stage IV sporulation protein FB